MFAYVKVLNVIDAHLKAAEATPKLNNIGSGSPEEVAAAFGSQGERHGRIMALMELKSTILEEMAQAKERKA